MQILFLFVMLVLPFVLSIGISLIATHRIYDHLSKRYARRSQRTLLAFFLFLGISVLVSELLDLLSPIVLSPTLQVALGALAGSTGGFFFWTINLGLIAVGLVFAFRISSDSEILLQSADDHSIRSNAHDKLLLTLIVILGLCAFIGPKIHAHWDDISAAWSRHSAQMQQDPKACTSISSSRERHRCILDALGTNNLLDVSDCSLLDPSTIHYNACIERQAYEDNDPDQCLKIDSTRSRVKCLRSHIGSSAWNVTCQSIRNENLPTILLIMGRCLTPETVDDLLVRSRSNPILEPAWFAAFMVNSYQLEEDSAYGTIITWLEELDADPNATDANGATVLVSLLEEFPQYVTQEKIELLIEFGVDPTIEDDTGKNALDYAQTLNDTTIHEQLQRAAGISPSYNEVDFQFKEPVTLTLNQQAVSPNGEYSVRLTRLEFRRISRSFTLELGAKEQNSFKINLTSPEYSYTPSTKQHMSLFPYKVQMASMSSSSVTLRIFP